MKRYAKIIIMLLLLPVTKEIYGQTVAMLTPSDVSRTVNVSVSVAKRAKLEVQKADNIVDVSDEDIKRGYVDINDAVVLKIWCNSIDGAKVMAQIDPLISGLKGKLLYRISGEREFQEATGSLDGIYESSKVERGSELSIDFRYILASSNTAGEYQYEASFVAEPK